jgi:hypothetical protein
MIDDPLNPGLDMNAESCGGWLTGGHSITIERSSNQAFRLSVIIPRHLGGYEQDIHIQVGPDFVDLRHVHPHTSYDYVAYQIFDIPSGLEDVILTFSNSINGVTVSTGFAFDAIPEPATLLLLSLGGLLVRKRVSRQMTQQ